MRVLFFTNLPSPYRVEFFNLLSEYCDLTVVYERHGANDRDPSWQSKANDRYRVEYLHGLNYSNDASISFQAKKIVAHGDYDEIVVSGYSSITMMLLIRYLKRKRIAYTLSVDGGIIRQERRINYLIKKSLINGAAWYLSTGECCDRFLTHYGVAADRIRRYPFTSIHESGIIDSITDDFSRRAYKQQIGCVKDKMILSIGQPIHRKGFDILIKAMNSIRDESVQVFVVGGGPNEECRQIMDETGCDNVSFIPFMSPEELSKYYLAADVFVLPTREDVWGLVINEAVAYGLPVITTDKCNAGLELVEDGINGRIIESENPKALSEAICDILNSGREETDRMRNASLNKAHKYTYETMVEAHMNHFRNAKQYILEVSWGCPSDKYPIHGIFQFDQARALHKYGKNIVFLSMDMRSFRRLRKWGINSFTKDEIPVYEFNFPYGPFSPRIKYRIQNHGFARAMKRITAMYGLPACVHFHCVMEAISGMKWCMDRNIPYIITEHNSPVEEGEEVYERMREGYRNADTVIAVSSALGRDISKAYGCDNYIVIPNIVDLSFFRYDENQAYVSEVPLQSDTFRFVTAAQMKEGKGYDILIQAFAKLTGSIPAKTDLVILGDGAERAKIEKMTRDLNISDRVSFLGEYKREQFAKELKACGCFVLPSRSETFGMVYTEALASGVPVIATKCGGPEDFVDDTNGMLVPVDDVDALAEAMKTMMNTLDRYDRRSISDKCIDRFSASGVTGQIAKTIDEIIRHGNPEDRRRIN